MQLTQFLQASERAPAAAFWAIACPDPSHPERSTALKPALGRLANRSDTVTQAVYQHHNLAVKPSAYDLAVDGMCALKGCTFLARMPPGPAQAAIAQGVLAGEIKVNIARVARLAADRSALPAVPEGIELLRRVLRTMQGRLPPRVVLRIDARGHLSGEWSQAAQAVSAVPFVSHILVGVDDAPALMRAAKALLARSAPRLRAARFWMHAPDALRVCHLAPCTALEQLMMSSEQSSTWADLAAVLPRLVNLTALDFRAKTAKVRVLNGLMLPMCALPRLAQLKYVGRTFCAESQTAHLSRLAALTRVCVSCFANAAGDNNNLFAALRALPVLRCLQVVLGAVVPGGAMFVHGLRLPPLPQLQALHVDGAVGAIDYTVMVARCRSLTQLSVPATSSVQMQSLVDALPGLRRLEEFGVMGDLGGAPLLMALLRQLESNPLRRLVIRGFLLKEADDSEDVVEAGLQRMLARCTALVCVKLSGLGVAASGGWMQCLGQLAGLRHLDLSNNKCLGGSVGALAQALARAPQLTQLVLKGMCLVPADRRALASLRLGALQRAALRPGHVSVSNGSPMVGIDVIVD